MNPFELTKDPDGGGITVRVKHGFVVLTREEERRVTERITEILAKNAKLRELCKWAILCSEGDVRCEACPYYDKTKEPHIICTMRKTAHELGVEVTQ